MPKTVPKHVAIRTDFRDVVVDSYNINLRLESVIAVKTRGSSEVFHGKIDHSQPPWNAGVANMILDLHAWSRDTEALWRLRAGLPARRRGGSSDNTRRALKALLGLSEGVDDSVVLTGRKWVVSWCWRANVVLGEEESAKRLPRSLGEREPKCPWCKRATLRQKALEGVIFCIDPNCVDEEQRRPRAQLEYFHGDMVLRWQDQIIGAP